MEITNQQNRQLQKLGRKFGLKLLLLHGSFATGKQCHDSDLDIAYLSSPNRKLTTFKQQSALHGDLASIFGDNYERELDIKSLHRVDPLFMYEVARDSQLLYGTNDDYVDFTLHAAARYDDNRTMFDLERILTRKMQQRLN